jgi:hypothetical protein
MSELTDRRRPLWRTGLYLLVILAVVAECVSYTVIFLLNSQPGIPIMRNAEFYELQVEKMQPLLKGDGWFVLDDHLGWRTRPGHSDDQTMISMQGLRSQREYTPVAAEGILRIAAFGDSFVYCNEVALEHAWPRRMEILDPSIEVLNYGVSTYGTDQAYLRYVAEGHVFEPDVVILGFFEADLNRLVNVFRSFISPQLWPRPKPRFVLDAGELRLLSNPVTAASYRAFAENPRQLRVLGVNDHWYRRLVFENPLHDWSATVRLVTTLSYRAYDRHFDPDRWLQIPSHLLGRGDLTLSYRPDSEAFRLQVEIFDAFAREVEARGALPIVLLFPTRGEMANRYTPFAPVNALLVTELRKRGIEVLDIANAVKELGSKEEIEGYLAPNRHYMPHLNDLVARWLLARIPKVVEANSGVGVSPSGEGT